MSNKKKILILCTGNSARSQMVEGLLKHIASNEYEVFSAGTNPSSVRVEAIQALREIGIDISQNRSKSVDEFADAKIDYILTVCDSAKENCPYFPARIKVIHHSFDDPAAVDGTDAEKLDAFRRVRDEIQKYLAEDFVKNIG